MNQLIIVVGAHGVGKTRLTDYLRDNLESCNLFRLSGQPDKSKDGLTKSIQMYEALLNYLEVMKDVSMTFVFDSFFMTEEAMSEIKDKEYSFHEAYQKFVKQLSSLSYDIYYFNLYLKDTSLFETRISSRTHHKYFAISLSNSVTLQSIYQKISDELKQEERIKVYDIAMDDFNKAYKEINEILGIRRDF